jgi:hypothetical protein
LKIIFNHKLSSSPSLNLFALSQSGLAQANKAFRRNNLAILIIHLIREAHNPPLLMNYALPTNKKYYLNSN